MYSAPRRVIISNRLANRSAKKSAKDKILDGRVDSLLFPIVNIEAISSINHYPDELF